MEHFEAKAKDLKLSSDTSTTNYMNIFKLYVQKLEKLEGSWIEEKKIQEFKDRVRDEDCDTKLRLDYV